MIIECSGLPGCGKTTLARRIQEELRASSIPCVWLNAPGGLRRALKLAGSTVLLLRPRNLSFAAALLGLFRRQKGPGPWSRVQIEKIRRLCVLQDTYRRWAGKKGCVLLCDQGIIQDTVALFRDTVFPAKEQMEPLRRMFAGMEKDLLLLYCHIPPETAAARAESRGRRACGLDFYTGEQLARFLEREGPLLEQAREGLAAGLPHMDLSMEEPVEKNAQIVMDRLRKILR